MNRKVMASKATLGRLMRGLFGLVALIAATCLAHPALAETRVALVVANSDYAGAPLANPQVDLGIIVPPLERAGFEVTTVSNAGLAEFDAALNAFAERARGADIALFYFAGHGFALNDGLKVSSYLMSTDADVTAASDRVLMADGIELDAIVYQLTASAKVSLVFVDACRNDPRVRALGASGRGLAPVADVSVGDVFIGLSTRVGDTATDGAPGEGSPFARAFANHMSEPGLSVDRAFNRVRLAVQEETGTQRPEAGRNDLSDPDAVVLMASASPAGQSEAAPTDAAGRAWAVTQYSTSPAVLTRFAENFPGTVYADLALARIEELRSTAEVSATVTPTGPKGTEADAPITVSSLPTGPGSSTSLLDFPAVDPSSGPFSEGCVDPETPGAGNTIPACQQAVQRDPRNASLQFLMGRSYGMQGDFNRALAWYGEAASSGHAQAMLHAGIFHRNGLGVPPDAERAAEWFERSARNGNSQAMALLGELRQGQGDFDAATRWYEDAAKGGNAYAMLRLGQMHLDGVGTPQNYKAASDWLEKAVAAGSRDAYVSLARVLSSGPGGLRDDRRAAELLLASLTFKTEGSEAQLAGSFSEFSLDTRKEMQKLLKAKGLYEGPLDGIFGSTSQRALQGIYSGPAGG